MPFDDQSTAPDGPLDLCKSDHIQIESVQRNKITTEVNQDTSANDHLKIDEAAVLESLTENVRNQDDLERDITNQANLLMIEHEDELDSKRLEKIKINIEKLEAQKRIQKRRLNAKSIAPDRCCQELERLTTEIENFKRDIADIESRVEERHQIRYEENESDCIGSNLKLPNESQKEYLIRTGKITPFFQTPGVTPEKILYSPIESKKNTKEKLTPPNSELSGIEKRSHQNLRLPGFKHPSTCEEEFSLRPRKKRKVQTLSEVPENYKQSCPEDDSYPSESDQNNCASSDIEVIRELDSETSIKKYSDLKNKAEDEVDLSGADDGNELTFQNRLKSWVKRRSTVRKKIYSEKENINDEDGISSNDEEEEWFKSCPGVPDHHFGADLKLPGDIHPALFDYQKTGIQWLGELYSQQVGGILGDEMGLGKTIQIISFLAGLHYCKKLIKPVIVITPATVLQQWVNEFHKWWPPMRVSILHSSGSGMMNLRHENKLDGDSEVYGKSAKKKSSTRVKRIVDQIIQKGHVLITTYAGLQTYANTLLDVDWGYAVLDEGHKIRNPNTAVTIYCKELKTPNRIIISGTPMQNNLVELWSLFDFIYPMRLGTLVSFRQTFETPIKQGGYANSTNLQIMTATKCAEELKNVISPYLLQRLKVDVASDLPKKTEQVLFVKLTKPQRDAYENFLASKEVLSIINGTRQSLYGIDILKKICNHPDLIDPSLSTEHGYEWADPTKSGKMKIVESLLQLWKGFNHKTLLFCQGTQMLDLLEHFIKKLGCYNYLRMDGSTNIKARQTLVDRFNTSPDIHVFLLTTKVGGLGVNLTGANRVLIFDPDWNPSTDIQARERAWRLGQKKEVTIYRLITAGTIEEKMYHRQIFKQFLTNKVLKDPKQRQTFQMKDLFDLFTLGNNENGTTETGKMFKNTEVQFQTVTNKVDSNDKTKTSSHANTVNSEQEDSFSQVRNLTGVVGLETFRGNLEEESTVSEEDRLMKGIFSGTDIQSALEHDQIINGKRIITADRGILEREAKKVASEAAAQLSKAAEVARKLTPGTVTWTGEFGSAGKLVHTSQANTRMINGIYKSRSDVSNGSGLSTEVPRFEISKPRGEDFKKLIISFIKRRGGSVQSQTLVNHFNRVCQTSKQTTDFKKMLDKVARLEFSTQSRVRGKWHLKDEYKQKD
ncbi:DNA repair and recombination protein RAD26 [Erysiphe neolycopersici]|uniref:DNA repair and recombination protein RAD26 n=1 Tax=Erysiphe neolycopersici TaxID=212602 RepID=A0A420HUU5_9PEZI|nr:DNA repair and recombination protein RAD26 [Erysiphe neolycopersici]